jgi:hypothetical protein
LLRKDSFACMSWLFVVGAILQSGCAGPVTPMGAVSALAPEHAFESANGLSLNQLENLADLADTNGSTTAVTDQGVSIDVTPSKQMLHGRSTVQITIHDSITEFSQLDLWIRYNGLDVTDSFLKGAVVQRIPSERMAKIENGNIRLDSTHDNAIEFFYRNISGAAAYFRYDPPRCSAFQKSELANTDPFRPSHSVVELIKKNAQNVDLNAAFLSGLIAQESGFNSRQISWAKAIGLTQVTSVAEEEIIDHFQDWPRYPGIKELPLAVLKVMIVSGEINRSNEWRLDPARSIEGGTAFVQLLSKRWSSEESQRWIRSMGLDPELERTRLLLASYHSGSARVQTAIARYGKNWISAPYLKEARKYVNQVMSYCYFFMERSPTHA